MKIIISRSLLILFGMYFILTPTWSLLWAIVGRTAFIAIVVSALFDLWFYYWHTYRNLSYSPLQTVIPRVAKVFRGVSYIFGLWIASLFLYQYIQGILHPSDFATFDGAWTVFLLFGPIPVILSLYVIYSGKRPEPLPIPRTR